MKRLKLFLSAYAPFPVLAWLGKTFLPYRVNPALLPNEISLYDLRVFYAHTLPLLFITALLLQYILVVPLWNRIANYGYSRKYAFSTASCVLLIIAIGLSYLVWDVKAGINTLIRSIITVLFVQVIYWAINLGVLYVMGISIYKKQHLSLM